MAEGTSASRIIQLLGGEVPISAVEGLEAALAGGVLGVSEEELNAAIEASEARGSDTYDQIGAAAAAAAVSVPLTQKAAANGVATLDGTSKIPTAQLPALAITDTFPVANQAAMLALTAQRGDVAVRADDGQSYILAAEPASTLGNWLVLSSAGGVTSVNGQTGVVTGLAEVADLAPLSDNVPLVAFGTGNAGAANDAARGDHAHPAQGFTLPQPLILEPAATNGPALVVNALVGQTGNLVEWRNSDDTLIAAIGAGAVDVSDGFGFPQYTGFPRLRGSNYSSFGLLKCTGAFQVEQNFFLVGVGGSQANYGNTGVSLDGGNLQLQQFGSGGSSKFRFLQGILTPQLRLGSLNVDFGTCVINLDTLSSAGIGSIIQGSSGQTADLSQWRSNDEAVGFAITAAQLPRWTKAANVQTTVGAAGGASALPASPTKYLKVVGDDGTTYVVPAFAAA